METTIIITLLIIAAVSIALNVIQCIERRGEKKEAEKSAHELIKESARLEADLEQVKADLENEENHRKWAIGRIKDQQAVIDQLKSNKGKTYKARKEGGHA